MIRETAKAIKILCDNRIEENVIINALLARTVSFCGLKNLKFDSIANKFGSVPFTHFAMSFVPSGGNKNNTVRAVDNIFSFLADDIEKINKRIKSQYIENELLEFVGKDKEKDKVKKRIEKEADEQEVLIASLSDSTVPALYDACYLIDKLKRGFIYVKNTEFSSYYEQIACNRASNNLLFLNTLYDLWDNSFTCGRKIRGNIRGQIDNITCSVLFMSSFIKMQQPDVRKIFKNDLLTGNVRRFLFTYDYNQNYFLNAPAEPTVGEVTQAKRVIEEQRERLRDAYNSILLNSEYIISDDVVEQLNEWYKRECEPDIKQRAKNTQSMNGEIINTYVYGCKWTIIKLLAVWHMFNRPESSIVTTEYLSDVVRFWKYSLKSLEDVLYSRSPDIVDLFVDCFIGNKNKALNRTDIRQYCGVDARLFKVLFDGNLADVESILLDKGYCLTQHRGSGNSQYYVCKEVEKVSDNEGINISVSFSKAEHPFDGYQYKTVTTDELKQLIKTCSGFALKEFKDGYRKDENVDSNTKQNTIWLDFDDGLTLEEAKEIFKPYWYVIYTSINHQKKKHNKVCDRFRVILKTKDMLPNNKADYNAVMEGIIQEYKADQNAKGLSRYFRGNPNAEIYTNDGAYFNWKGFCNQSTKTPTAVAFSQRSNVVIDNNNKRILCDENLFTQVGNDVLQVDQITAGNRDNGMQRAIGILVTAVNNGDVSHENAIKWVENTLFRITDKEFEEQANKFINKIKELRV